MSDQRSSKTILARELLKWQTKTWIDIYYNALTNKLLYPPYNCLIMQFLTNYRAHMQFHTMKMDIEYRLYYRGTVAKKTEHVTTTKSPKPSASHFFLDLDCAAKKVQIQDKIEIFINML